MGRAAEAARSRSDVEANSRPMIRVREGSTAEISNMSGTDYIQDYTVGADGKTQAVHATAEDGLALEMRPRAREAQLELDFRVKRCQLASWTEESERTLSNGETVKLKYPIVAKREVHSKATLAQGECLAVMLSTTNSRSEEHTSELQSLTNIVCRLLLEKKKIQYSGPAFRARRFARRRSHLHRHRQQPHRLGRYRRKQTPPWLHHAAYQSRRRCSRLSPR